MARFKTRSWTSSKIEHEISKLQEFHDAGQARTRYEHQADDDPISDSDRETRAKSRLFTDRVTGYSQTDLKKLFKQCRRAGWVLPRSHIIRLLSVPKGPVRDGFQIAAITGRWSKMRLNMEIMQQLGNQKPYAGLPRAFGEVKNSKLVLLQLIRQWQRTRARIRKQLKQDAGMATNLDRTSLPSRGQIKQIDNLSRSMSRLLKSLSKQS